MLFFLFILAAALSYLLVAGLVLVWISGRQSPRPSKASGISIIVAAHNEEKNLPALLNALCNQRYEGEYEIVLVLDRCTDQSVKIAGEWQEKFPLLNVIQIGLDDLTASPKKNALNKGLQSAKYDCYAFTDADCVPGPGWVTEISSHLGEDTEIVLGMSPYIRRKGLLNTFIQFETLLTGLQYAGLALLGLPYMAVGRNLAYRRSFIESTGGFRKFMERLSGDDDLPVNRFARGRKLAVMRTPESAVLSSPPITYRQWIRQKMRHFSAANAYTFVSRAILAVWHGAHAIFYLSLFCLLLTHPHWEWALAVWGGRTLLLMILLSLLPGWWRDVRVILGFPLLDLLYLFYYLLAGTAGLATRPTWNKS